MSLTLLTPPTHEPISLIEARAFLRIEQHEEDALIAGLISLARRACEDFTRRSLITQQWRLAVNLSIDRRIKLPNGPVQNVDVVRFLNDSVTTIAASDSYRLDKNAEPAVLQLDFAPWPLTGAQTIEVDYTAGYGADWNAVPLGLRQGILRLVAHQYRFRDDPEAEAIPTAVAALWTPYRAIRL